MCRIYYHHPSPRQIHALDLCVLLGFQHALETYRWLVIAMHNRAYRTAQPSGSTGIESVALLSSALSRASELAGKSQLSAISSPPGIHCTWRGIEDRRASISSAHLRPSETPSHLPALSRKCTNGRERYSVHAGMTELSPDDQRLKLRRALFEGARRATYDVLESKLKPPCRSSACF